MQAAFAFGKTGLTVTLPDGPRYSVVEGRTAGALEDPAAAIDAALDHPIGCQPLVELAAGKRTAAISVCDITRPAPNSQTLPPLLERLHTAGIPVDGITILIATGLHRCATGEEIQSIVGPEIAARYRVVNHDARAMDDHRSLGATASGTPVYIDRRFLDAELHITLGFIEPHWMLGYSGGRKLIAPGLAAQQTIQVLHSPRFMREPLANEGSVERNPLHAELLEVVRMARHDFLLDVALTQERAICGVFAGSPEQAHAAGVEFVRSTTMTRVPQFFDAAIVSAAGHPLDLTFYQSLKGFHSAHHIVKPGGRILLLCECAEGIGSPEFAAMLHSYAGPRQFLDQIANAPVIIDQWQLEKIALAALRNEMLLYTPGVLPEQIGALGKRCYSNVNQAVAALFDGLPADVSVALIPEGPYAFAEVAE
ncbi:MAG TPA: nickel-dependent lactate racemase [Acidobacteriaceae bacterium]|jgi:nickel-dependent lactate racemase|nr:nickel-dependent lactate racemase [Acidobacteriaceae bacterium]